MLGSGKVWTNSGAWDDVLNRIGGSKDIFKEIHCNTMFP